MNSNRAKGVRIGARATITILGNFTTKVCVITFRAWAVGYAMRAITIRRLQKIVSQVTRGTVVNTNRARAARSKGRAISIRQLK